jgi:hypothetical protein
MKSLGKGGQSLRLNPLVKCRMFALSCVAVGSAGLMYLVFPFILFDFTQPAYCYAEDQFEGRRVAFGPRPRWFLVPPTYHGLLYDGTEWPFSLYRRLCLKWLSEHDYRLPSVWREEPVKEAASMPGQTTAKPGDGGA